MYVITQYDVDTVYGPFLYEEHARAEFDTIDQIRESEGFAPREGRDRYTIELLEGPQEYLYALTHQG